MNEYRATVSYRVDSGAGISTTTHHIHCLRLKRHAKAAIKQMFLDSRVNKPVWVRVNTLEKVSA